MPVRLETLATAPWRTRFAPAPTGHLHLGHAVSALYVWGLARAFGGRVVLRIEDHDRGRSRPEYEEALVEDLEWLGLVPDETAPRQSERMERYEEVLARLHAAEMTYACLCTRKQIRARVRELDRLDRLDRSDGEGPSGRGGRELRGELWYPGTCRIRAVDPQATPIRRLRLDPEPIAFDDLLLGPQVQVPADQCGDLLLRNRAGHWTYHFAVAIDDRDQGIDVVIRGEDLLASTGRQLQLGRLLDRVDGADGAEMPRYLHHPLVLDPSGRKLSKSDGDAGVRELRAAGRTPESVLGEAAARAGLQEAPRPLDLDAVAGMFRDRLGRSEPA